MIFRSSAGVFLGFAVYSFGKPSSIDVASASKSIAVLDLVDLGDNQPMSGPSEGLRRSLMAQNVFQVIPGGVTTKKLSEFGVAPGQPCNNVQCSFDAGGYLQVDFVLFGTYSPLDATHSAVTLKLLYVAEGRITWTWAGELSTDSLKEDGWVSGSKAPSEELALVMKEGRLTLPQPSQHRSLALLDMSENFSLSRIFSERVSTHVHGLTRYEPISPSEQSELLSALGINKYAIAPSSQNMMGVGERLGASGLVYARIYRDGDSYLCRLAMYDIEHKATLLEFPPRPTQDFARALEYEDDFFSALSGMEAVQGKKDGNSSRPAVKEPRKSNMALWISLGLLGVGGGLTALWVESLKK